MKIKNEGYLSLGVSGAFVAIFSAVFLAVLCVLIYILIYGYSFVELANTDSENSKIGNLGSWGDFFAGVANPFLGFISTLLLLFTIFQNRLTIKKSTEEIELTRQEMERQSEIFIQQSESAKEELHLARKRDVYNSTMHRYEQARISFENIMAEDLSWADSKYKDLLSILKKISFDSSCKDLNFFMAKNDSYKVYQIAIIRNLDRALSACKLMFREYEAFKERYPDEDIDFMIDKIKSCASNVGFVAFNIALSGEGDCLFDVQVGRYDLTLNLLHERINEFRARLKEL